MNLAEKSQAGKAALLYFIAGTLAALPWVVAFLTILRPYIDSPWFLAFKPIWTGIFLLGILLWKSFEQCDDAERKLENAMTQKFKPSIILGEGPCKICTTNDTIDARTQQITAFHTWYFRLRVDAGSLTPIPECTAYLTRVEKGEEIRFDQENIQLSYANGRDHDTHSKTVRLGLSQYLDVINIAPARMGCLIEFGTQFHPFSVDLSKIFKDYGEYQLFITLVGKGIQPCFVKVNFNWTGEMTTTQHHFIRSSSTPL